MDLLLLPDDYAICKVDTPPSLPLPGTVPELYSLTVTDEETSIVCPEAYAPRDGAHEMGFRAFRVAGQLPFNAVGIMSKLSGALAEANIPIFAISSFNTDYILVHHTRLEAAESALTAVGYRLRPAEEA